MPSSLETGELTLYELYLRVMKIIIEMKRGLTSSHHVILIFAGRAKVSLEQLLDGTTH